LDQGQLPLSELAQGLLVAVGGALLLTPGFATDAFGFACLLPGTRAAMGHALKRWLEPRLVARAQFTARSSSTQPPRPEGDVLDGEFRRED
ncbi:MAG: FxsA family protein, partial [Litorivicinus sp.]